MSKQLVDCFFKFFGFLRIVFEIDYCAHPKFLDLLPSLTLLTLVKTYKSKSPRDHCYHFDREAIKMKALVLLALSTLASAQLNGQPRSKYDIFTNISRVLTLGGPKNQDFWPRINILQGNCCIL